MVQSKTSKAAIRFMEFFTLSLERMGLSQPGRLRGLTLKALRVTQQGQSRNTASPIRDASL
jgi:hypothetical protein